MSSTESEMPLIEISMDSPSNALSAGMSPLYVSKELTDLRIVCTDGSLMAHKPVLAAVSDRFRQLLVANSDGSHDCSSAPTLLLLADMSVKDIKPIVDIIYFGRLLIDSNRAKQLTEIGDKFNLKLVFPSVDESGQQLAYEEYNKMPTDVSPLAGQLAPKPAHQNCLLLSDKKLINRSIESKTFDKLKAITIEEKSMDLSFESIVSNGLNRKERNRRRKQSVPKQAIKKLAKYEESNDQCFTNELTESFDNIIDELSDVSATVRQSVRKSSALSQFETHLTANDNQLDDIPIITAIKTEEISSRQSLLKPKASKSSKNLAKGLEMRVKRLHDCPLCGTHISSYKKLSNHLNKEHKTNDLFKCLICDKEQKDAKTFAQHLIQMNMLKYMIQSKTI